ncbi:MAG TPA: hypothetical protein IAC64_05545 [Candidatus Caccomorpha excrementavium]|nr:hypothetical protein [Candidatus Caccomorpha excrementavium]
MRTMEFRMERPGLLKAGDEVELRESTLQTLAGTMYYYTIEPALAMSNNTPKRLRVRKGTVLSVEEEESVYTVTAVFDEPE